MSAIIHDITASSVSTRPGGNEARATQLRQLKEASRLREERMKRVIVLPDATKDLRELTGDDTVEFTVTIKRGSQADVALLPDCPPQAREYVEVYIESLNHQMFEWARGNPDVETDKLDEKEKRIQNIEIGSKAQERVMSEFGGVDYEEKRRFLADAFCLALVVDPEIVPTEDDIVDPDSQIALESLSRDDRQFIQNECGRLEEVAIESELKSVSSGDEEAEDGEGLAIGGGEEPEAGAAAEAGGDAADDASDAEWVHAG